MNVRSEKATDQGVVNKNVASLIELASTMPMDPQLNRLLQEKLKHHYYSPPAVLNEKSGKSESAPELTHFKRKGGCSFGVNKRPKLDDQAENEILRKNNFQLQDRLVKAANQITHLKLVNALKERNEIMPEVANQQLSEMINKLRATIQRLEEEKKELAEENMSLEQIERNYAILSLTNVALHESEVEINENQPSNSNIRRYSQELFLFGSSDKENINEQRDTPSTIPKLNV